MNALDQLINLMKTLRSEHGCDWDKAQTHESLIPYLYEECNELVDAIIQGDFENFKEELGDVLFQLIFQTCIAEEQGEFTFDDVIKGIVLKMRRRHPHVFEGVRYASPEAQKQAWQTIKMLEKRMSPHFDHLIESSILNDIKSHHSAMDIAIEMQKKCAEVGFDWKGVEAVFLKLDEEVSELKVEISEAQAQRAAHIEEEFGDLMFVMMNLARHLQLNPDIALRKANHKFKKRFQYIEKSLSSKGSSVEQSSIEEMERLWLEAKLALA